jgi:hypothetical protein
MDVKLVGFNTQSFSVLCFFALVCLRRDHCAETLRISIPNSRKNRINRITRGRISRIIYLVYPAGIADPAYLVYS